MFKSLDVLIGLSVVMLILSLAVTVITQFIAIRLNFRGTALRTGLVRLLGLIDSENLKPADCERIVDYVLRHSLVSSNGRLACTIHREEFTKLVIDFSVGGAGAKADSTQKAATAATMVAKLPGMGVAAPDAAADADCRARLLAVLQNNGIPDPAAALESVRLAALKLETTVPELSSNVRQTMALVQYASGDFLAKTNAWFDQTVDRATDVVSGRSHWVTAGVGAIVAIGLHVNTLDILNRLSTDSKVRDSLVAAAITRPTDFAPREATPVKDETVTHMYKRVTDDKDFRALTDANLVTLPSSLDDWLGYWLGSDDSAQTPADGVFGRIAGVILTVALLSLGAPLWYQLLGNLTNLRSLVTRRDDQQRTERQTTQTAALPVRAVEPARADQAPRSEG